MSAIENRVCSKIQKRAELGLSKYGVPLENTQLSAMEVLNHAQEEAMDLANYIETLMQFQTHQYLVVYDDDAVELFEKLPEGYLDQGANRVFHITTVLDLFHAVGGRTVRYNYETLSWGD